MAPLEGFKSEEIVFEIDGSRITAAKFRKGLNAFLDVIDEVAKDISGTTKSVNWIISVSPGSLRLHLRPESRSRQLPPHMIPVVLDAIQFGFAKIESSAERPEHFSDTALKRARELASVVNGKDGELDAIRIRRNGHTNRVTTKTLANVDLFFGTASSDWGSVEGRLRIVSSKGRYTFSVYDDIEDTYIPCHFPNELLEDVLGAFEKRVSVSGILRYTGRGDVKSVDVESFQVFPEKDKLPGFDDVYGLFGGAD